ncbi:hypothetical protein ACIF6I_03440 [Streptomyces microflavus]|uniref:Uncharacterized protein n=1 Tax=Streptomyces microflavus DSM 40593 TaxID=1303692 RepID=N0D0E8_STRMI|nr:hypothetical protein [Streptomyces microflavus]AGK81831.1 hypothetical protein SFUL_6954 [Streptomyces microflavus DSM 40593]
MSSQTTGAGTTSGLSVLDAQHRRVFNFDLMMASFGGAGGGIGLVAFADHMDEGGIWNDLFLYLAPVVAITSTFVVSWAIAKLEEREIRSKNSRAVKTIQAEISDPETGLDRKNELRAMLRKLQDERIALRL